jgi:MoaA/NifB/PqqE/SkfB family radical SAM enzyme
MNDRQKNIEANQGAPESWCVLPWSHVSIKGNGTFRVCCHSSASESRGTLKNNNGDNLHISLADWDSVVNSDLMKSVRTQMLNGEWPEPCVRCKREFESGMQSRNIYERSLLADIIEPQNYPSFKKAKELTASDGTIKNEDFPVSFLDIRFGNLCNLKCIMCSPTDSDQWYDDYNSVWGYEFFWDSGEKIPLEKNNKNKLKPAKNIFEWNNDPNLWKEIEKHISQFRRIYIVGGEPLIIDAHYDFLQKCVDEGYADKLTIEYNSNITNIPQRAWNIWKYFKNVIIGVSIDGFGDVNDLIRFPSKWWKIEENLKKFTVAEGNYDIHITTTVQMLNIWQLPQFIEYIIENNLSRVGPWHHTPIMSPHPVHRPPYLNVNILPEKFKEEIKIHFEKYKHKFQNTNYQELVGDSNGASWQQKVDHACKILDTYSQYMYKIDYPDQELIKWRSNCVHYLDKLDQIRKTDWKSVCPELYHAISEWYELPKGLF